MQEERGLNQKKKKKKEELGLNQKKSLILHILKDNNSSLFFYSDGDFLYSLDHAYPICNYTSDSGYFLEEQVIKIK